MPLTERLLELVPFMIRRLSVVERVTQREAWSRIHRQVTTRSSRRRRRASHPPVGEAGHSPHCRPSAPARLPSGVRAMTQSA